jgi:hypothetical protein
MYTHRKTLLLVVCFLVIISLACNLGTPPGAPAANPDETNAEEQPSEEVVEEAPPEEAAEAPTEVVEPTPTPIPTATPIPALPIGLRQGLAGLNSYHLVIETITNGPAPQDKSHTKYQTDYVMDGEKSLVRTESTSSTAKEPAEKSSVSDVYQIGNKSCTISGTGADREVDSSNIDIQQKEMMDTMTQLEDMIIVVENPKFVGAETINGVQSNHFKFNVTGLGKKSGAEVTQSAGEYWVAQDGQYLMKYDVVLETRSAPAGNAQAQVMHQETHLNLSNINQPIQINMPVDCK